MGGAAMDTKLLKAGADAHHAAIGGLSSNGVCSEAQLTAINAAIGRMIASVPESKTMDVYNSVSALVDPKVPEYLMSTVKEADAKAAYSALIDFTNVVKAHPITPSTPASLSPADPSARLLASFRLLLTRSSRMLIGLPTCFRGYGCEGCADGGRLRGHQCGTWEGDCVGADQQGHGCLQRDGRSYWEQPCPEQVVLDGESPRCAGGVQRAARVQGCGEGGTALSHRIACGWTFSPSGCGVHSSSV